MKLDTQELDQVAAAAVPRVDMYAGIHKALRAFMADTLLAVGRMDADDALERAEVTQRVLELLAFCRSHVQHENDFVHAALEARAPGSSSAIAHDHEEHLAAIGQLAALARAVLEAAPAERAAAQHRLYLALSLFIADNLQHMHQEETAHNAALWAHYGDAELVALHDALVASIPPAEMLATVRWLVPFMRPAERVGLLADIRAKVPALAFQAMLETVQPHLSAREWEKLQAALGA